MPWPGKIIEQFEFINKFTSNEHKYYRPWTSLLFEVFPVSNGYCCGSQYQLRSGFIDLVVQYAIPGQKWRVPVLFVEVKTFNAYVLQGLHPCQSRQSNVQLVFLVSSGKYSMSLPTLYGISTLGTQICVYKYTDHNRTLTLKHIMHNPKFVNDTAPMDRWSLDIMELEGEARMQEIVAHIQAMVAGYMPQANASSV
ncbi:hypothetical protein EDC04DRAFT_2598768 [Pisolithus marmoratus]|nr:hypothetical protein EDC04DRAFT_2598768 [Pisolithus marmoratus]